MVEEDLDGLAADSSRIQADEGMQAAEAALQGKISQRTGDEAVQQQLAAHKDETVALDLEEPASVTRPVDGQEEKKEQVEAATAPSQHEQIAEAPKPQENVLEAAEERLDGLVVVEASVTQALDETALLNLQEDEQPRVAVGPSPRVESIPQAASPAQASDPGLLAEPEKLNDPQVSLVPQLALSSCPSTRVR